MPVRTTNAISFMGDFCMSVLKNRISAVVAGSAVLVAIGATSAVAGNLIGSDDIRDGGVHRVDLGAGVNARIDNKATDGQVNGLNGRVTELEDESDSSETETNALAGRVTDLEGASNSSETEANALAGRVTDLEGETDSGSDLIVGAGYTSTWAANSYGETIETCPEGQYAIGGGYSTFGGFGGTHDDYDLGGTNRNIEVTVSAPYFKGAYEPVDEAGNFRADQWVVRGYNNGDTDQVVRAWVVCSNLAN